MRRVRGRPRHGSARKESKTISLDGEAWTRLEKLGNGCLSMGVAIAEHIARTIPLESIALTKSHVVAAAKPDPRRTWIVFELVDGPPDPEPIPPEGLQLDAWRM